MGRLLARIYRKFFWRAYDNIGRLLALNLLWFVIFPVPTYLCFRLIPVEGIALVGVTLLVGLLTASYAGAGVFGVTERLARRDEIDGGPTALGPSGAPDDSGGASVVPGGATVVPGKASVVPGKATVVPGGAPLGPDAAADTTGPGPSQPGTGPCRPGPPSSVGPSPSPGLLRSFFGQAWRYFPRMALLGLIFGGVIALLFHSIRFYSDLRIGGGAGGGIVGFFLAGIQIWILAFCVLMQVYAFPLLCLKDWGVRRILKWSAILVILRPGLTVLVFIQAFALFGLLTFTGVGFVLLAYGHTALFLNAAVLEILKEMEDKWIAKKKPTSWKEIMAERDADDRRTLRDILRPWD